jgi:hypothetical protein
MPSVSLFCEDSFHEKFLGALLRRFEAKHKVGMHARFLSAQGGLPKMHGELRSFLRDLERERRPLPDAIIVVADANCLGYNARKGSLASASEHHGVLQPLISYAIPDPHIERWMLADPAAFQQVFGRGCTLPAIKCAKDEYKRLLRKEIRASGIEAPLGGEEFAEDIVSVMNLAQVQTREPSLGLLLRDLRGLFNRWRANL